MISILKDDYLLQKCELTVFPLCVHLDLGDVKLVLYNFTFWSKGNLTEWGVVLSS